MNENHVDVIKNYYKESNEDNRMEENPLEFIRCKEIIRRFLVEENLSILDVGGGTGAFSFWLSSLGHQVSLIDFVPKHIEIAKEREIKESICLSSRLVGDARSLPYDDDFFDLVLSMGPLYHLTEECDRIKSLKEVYRVLKPNGRIVAEVISRYASMVDGFLFDLVSDPHFIPIMVQDINTGLHKDTSPGKQYFTNSFFHCPESVRLELEKSGFWFEDLVAVTSFGCTIPNINEKLKDENYRKILLETISQVEKEPSLMGISSHYIGVGRKNI